MKPFSLSKLLRGRDNVGRASSLANQHGEPPFMVEEGRTPPKAENFVWEWDIWVALQSFRPFVDGSILSGSIVSLLASSTF